MRLYHPCVMGTIKMFLAKISRFWLDDGGKYMKDNHLFVPPTAWDSVGQRDGEIGKLMPPNGDRTLLQTTNWLF